MKNISPQTIKLLSSLGYDVKAVAETGSKGHEDNEIVALAQAEKRVIKLMTLVLVLSTIFPKEVKSESS